MANNTNLTNVSTYIIYKQLHSVMAVWYINWYTRNRHCKDISGESEITN